jgi:GT2 family glycosyltransferase
MQCVTGRFFMSLLTTSARPLISVLVLNWNGEQCLARCLDAVASQTYPNFEALVLDNASTDHSVDDVPARWPSFRLIRFDSNLGFAAANNRGAVLAAGEWLAFLNNDAFPYPDWLSNLVQAIDSEARFSSLSSRLVYADQAGRLQSSGDVYNISGYAWSRDNNRPWEQAHQAREEVFSPCAAAALYRKDAFFEAGGFDESFSSHHEDVDLGFRLRLLGHRCLYEPEAVVAHIGSFSYGRESDRTVYQVQRNVVWSYFTNMPGWLFWKYLPAHLLANLIFAVYYALRGQARPVLRAKWDALRELHGLREKRAQIQRARRVSPDEIDRILDHHLLGPYTLGMRTRNIRLLLESSEGSRAPAKRAEP